MLRLNAVAIGFIASCLSAQYAFAQTAPMPMPAPVAPPPAPVAAPPAAPPEAAPVYAAPMELRYVEGRPIPPGYHLETRARRGLVVSGPIIFGIPYVLSASVAASSRNDGDRWLYVPVVGPFADLGARSSNCDRSTFNTPSGTSTTEICSDDSAARFFLMLDGLMQTAGATMLILGLALPSHHVIRDDAPYSASAASPVVVSVRPARLGRGGYGLAIDGLF